MLFSHRVDQGCLALPRLCDGQPIGRLEMDRANDIGEPKFLKLPGVQWQIGGIARAG